MLRRDKSNSIQIRCMAYLDLEVQELILLITDPNFHMTLIHMQASRHLSIQCLFQTRSRSQHKGQLHHRVMYLLQHRTRCSKDLMNLCSGHISMKRVLSIILVHSERRDCIKTLILLVRCKHSAHLQVQGVPKMLLVVLWSTVEQVMNHSPTLVSIQVKGDSCWQHATPLEIETTLLMSSSIGISKAQMTR